MENSIPMSEKPMRVAIYARVSTNDQTSENQLIDLRRYCRERDWTVFEEFVDHAITGKKDKRPALDRMMDFAKKRKIDTVLVWRFDRFARSLKHLVLVLEEFRSLNISFVSFQENIDTCSPLGQALYYIIGVMAELEHSIIVERVKAGLRRAKLSGQKLGRPATDADHNLAFQMRAAGRSIREIAKELKVGKSTIARILGRESAVICEP